MSILKENSSWSLGRKPEGKRQISGLEIHMEYVRPNMVGQQGRNFWWILGSQWGFHPFVKLQPCLYLVEWRVKLVTISGPKPLQKVYLEKKMKKQSLELCHRNWRFVDDVPFFGQNGSGVFNSRSFFFWFSGRCLIVFCLKEMKPHSAHPRCLSKVLRRLLRRNGSSSPPTWIGKGLSSIDPLRNFGVHHNHRSPLRGKKKGP